MVSLVKNALYKTVGKATLSWKELGEVFLDIENTLNNQLLTYVEDNVEYPILTNQIPLSWVKTYHYLTITKKQKVRKCAKDLNMFENAKKQHGSDGERNISSH